MTVDLRIWHSASAAEVWSIQAGASSAIGGL